MSRPARFAALGAVLLGLAWLFPCPAAGDQFILKDGRKISGTVVGFQDGMFRVETEFGFALIRKDKVAKILIESGAGEKAEEKNISVSALAAGQSSPPAAGPAAARSPNAAAAGGTALPA